MIGSQVFSLRSFTRISFCLLALASVDIPTASAARPYSVSRSVSRYRSPYYASPNQQYRSRSAYRYSTGYSRNYAVSHSTYYGYGARRYNYRYRPYAASAGYRYYRPNYYRFNGYPAYAGISYNSYNSFYPRRICNSWNSYSSCYCSPYSGYRSSYVPYGGGYSFAAGSYAPYWGSYVPNWGAYYGAPWSYSPGYYGNFYGPYCSGIWPYRPSLYGSIVFQAGYNMGYGRGSYYRFW